MYIYIYKGVSKVTVGIEISSRSILILNWTRIYYDQS